MRDPISFLGKTKKKKEKLKSKYVHLLNAYFICKFTQNNINTITPYTNRKLIETKQKLIEGIKQVKVIY